MDLNLFTEKSQAALAEAQTLATRQQHQAVDVEHLALALLEQEGGLVPRLFERMRPSPDLLRAKIEDELGKLPRVSGSATTGQGVYVTQRLNKLLVHAQDEAKQAQGRVRQRRAPGAGHVRGTAGQRHRAGLQGARREARRLSQGPHRGARQPARHQRQSRGDLRGARRNTDATSPAWPSRTSSIRSSAATARSAAASRCSPVARRTTRC